MHASSNEKRKTADNSIVCENNRLSLVQTRTMRLKLLSLLLLIFITSLAAQTGPASAPTGVLPEWEIQKLVSDLKQAAEAMRATLPLVKPADWVTRGAPSTYVILSQAAQEQLDYLQQSYDTLRQEPERLSLALDAYFRLVSVKDSMRPLIDGASRYQNADLAQLLQQIADGHNRHAMALREYIVALVAQKERELQIVDGEAQRCRAMIISRESSRESSVAKKRNTPRTIGRYASRP